MLDQMIWRVLSFILQATAMRSEIDVSFFVRCEKSTWFAKTWQRLGSAVALKTRDMRARRAAVLGGAPRSLEKAVLGEVVIPRLMGRWLRVRSPALGLAR